VHSIVDDCSRLAYSEIHPDERAATVTAFTTRALDWLLEQGIMTERLMTDNAFAYTQNRSLRQLLRRRAIRHIRTRPYTPRTNGKVERFHQTLMREWAYALEYASSEARREALPHSINHYNERRTHSALSNRPPHQRVRDVLGPTARAGGGLMAAARPDLPASFLYEPSAPPTIQPGLTIDDWRRQQARRHRRRRHQGRRRGRGRR
jgi:integrase-like protein